VSSNRGCFFNTVLFLVIVFVPVLGHILATLMVLEDDHSTTGKILWLAVIWLMPPWVVLGPLLYLLFGQRRRSRVTFGQPTVAYSQPQPQQQPYYQPQQQQPPYGH
jgi:Phospholipase_D-nuclease N-terminal